MYGIPKWKLPNKGSLSFLCIRKLKKKQKERFLRKKRPQQERYQKKKKTQKINVGDMIYANPNFAGKCK